MMSFLFVAAFAIVCAGLGWPVVARYDRACALTSIERMVAAFAIGTLIIYFAVFAVGPFRLDRTSLGLVSLAAGLLAIPGLRAMPWKRMGASIRSAVADARRDPVAAVLWLAALGVGLSTFLQAFAPPNDYDSLMYHLAIPQLDVERGYIAPPWEHGLSNAFLPAGLYHLYRLALLFADGGAAQAINAVFGLIAAMAAAAIARRMGAGPRTALLAALLFLATRLVVWEMATSAVDPASAAWFGLGLIAYLAWRKQPEPGLLVLLGLTIGGGILAKYHGAVAALGFGTLLLIDLVRGRVGLWLAAGVPLLSFIVILPHLARMYHFTGNPIFPLFNPSFVPGGASLLDPARFMYGTGRGIVDLLTTPISFSLMPMHLYDGMILGAPYFLALAPLALLARRDLTLAGPVLVATFVFYVLWFYRLGHQVRFLMSVFPVLAAFAAIGAAALWRQVRPHAWGRIAFAGLTIALVLNQLMFVGAYAALRLPAALGLKSAAAYHATPTMNGGFYGPCMYVRAHLKPGERYLSLIRPHFYYCPQAQAQLDYLSGEEKSWLRADATLRPMSLPEFVAFFEASDFRFVAITVAIENRRNETGESLIAGADWSWHRFGQYVAPAVRSLTPLARDDFAAVYDGREVLAELRKLPAR
jgi:4-amino-4-deoxy-L-arabinose transferase-like glycosyltransferase